MSSAQTSIADMLARRRVLRNSGLGAMALGAVAATGRIQRAQAADGPLSDVNILNFALNLEYVEAEFYSRAVFGKGLANVGANPGPVTGGRQVSFATPALQQFATEIANDEITHVNFLRSVLGSAAVDRPAIDLTNSFNAIAQATGLASSFDPFADETSFFIGAYVFEDVGVTAYHGAAPYVLNRTYLSAAAGILAVEAYHAANIRTVLYSRDQGPATNAISKVRATLSQAADDYGVVDASGNSAIVLTDSNALAFARTPRQVLNVVYGMIGASKGGFLPNGANGVIS